MRNTIITIALVALLVISALFLGGTNINTNINTSTLIEDTLRTPVYQNKGDTIHQHTYMTLEQLDYIYSPENLGFDFVGINDMNQYQYYDSMADIDILVNVIPNPWEESLLVDYVTHLVPIEYLGDYLSTFEQFGIYEDDMGNLLCYANDIKWIIYYNTIQGLSRKFKMDAMYHFDIIIE